MNILNTILQSSLDENILNTLSRNTGIDSNSVESLVQELAPSLLDGAKKNLASNNDSSDLITMISNTNLDTLIQNPDSINNFENRNMLGQLFSSLNQSQEDMTSALSAKSGVDSNSIASLLPMVAPLVMGALNKQTNLSSQNIDDTNEVTTSLLSLIDQDNDGSVVDDIVDIAGKFFK